MSQVEYVFRYRLTEQEDGRWSAECPDLPDCNTYGDDQEHALARVTEAIMGMVEIHERDGTPVPAFITGTRKIGGHDHEPTAFIRAGSHGKTLDGLLTA